MIKALWLIMLINLMLCMPQFTHAQWEEVPKHGTTLDFGGLQNDKASSYTAQAIHAGKRGWVGLQANQIRADGEAKSNDIDARVQTGFGFAGVSLQIFAESNRSMDTELATSTGGYLRKTLTYNKLDLVFGAGSLLEREEVRADYGLDATDPTVSPYWIGIVAAKYKINDAVGFSTRIIGNPEVAFAYWKGQAEFAIEVRVADNALLKFQSTNAFEQHETGYEVDTENSVLLSLNY